MNRLRLIVILILSLSPVTSGKAYAQVQDVGLKNIGDRFSASIPSDWKNEAGGWQYADIADCYVNGGSCFGNNPTSPYGSPTFLDSTLNRQLNAFHLNANEAVVIIMRTPPEMRYFGFTQYLMQNGSQPSVAPVFASMSDALNLMRIGTAGASAFGQYAAVVWSGDLNTYTAARALLMQAGLPEGAINFIPMPVNLPVHPLKTGYGPGTDTFGMLMRTAIPKKKADWDAYMTEKPFIVSKIGPTAVVPLAAAPTIGYSNTVSGVAEGKGLQLALNKLVADIKKNYRGRFTLQPQEVSYSSKTGWDCIAGNEQCAGDTFDALYSRDIERPLTVKNLEDFVIVVGVNHQKTGKATYINHSIYDTKKMAGIVSVTDPSMTTESALYHAGVTSLDDSRRALYQNLYAYAISYDCAGRLFCLAIPAPTPENPVGLIPGAPFIVVGRAYADPHTMVRPSIDEIVHHQVLIGTKN